MKNFAVYFIFVFVFKKASQPLREMDKTKEEWKSCIKKIYKVGIFFNVLFFIIYTTKTQIFVWSEENRLSPRDLQYESKKIACTTPVWLINAFVDILILLIFYQFVRIVN